MAREKQRDRIYLKCGRFYADFRDYADVGGCLMALIPTGQRMATKERDVANLVAAEHVLRLDAKRHGRAFGGITNVTTLSEASHAYLVDRAEGSKAPGATWLAQCERHLRAACLVLGDARDPSTISLKDVKTLDVYLATVPLVLPSIEGRRGRIPTSGLEGGTRRHYLNTLSKLFKWMGTEGMVPRGHNPVEAMQDKPTWTALEREFLEVDEAGVYLHAASLYEPERSHGVLFAHALIGVFLHCGLRASEAFQLLVSDVNLTRNTISVRWKRKGDAATSSGGAGKKPRLKTRFSVRTVPISPELRRILVAYLTGSARPRGQLLFPSPAPERHDAAESRLTDIRTTLEQVARVAQGIAPAAMKARFSEPALFRTLLFRHTFCAARLQCVDNKMPISRETVEYEMGHGSRAMIDRVYKHLGRIRHRSENVEYPNPLEPKVPRVRRAS